MKEEAQNTKNKLIYKKLVKNYWGLTEEAYLEFKDKLLYGREIAKEYKHLIKDSPDLRARFPLEKEDYISYNDKNEDISWRMFKKFLKPLITGTQKEINSISYSNFISNKITYKKNQVKLIKLACTSLNKIIDNLYDFENDCYKQDIKIKENLGIKFLLNFVDDIEDLTFQTSRTIVKLREVRKDLRAFIENNTNGIFSTYWLSEVGYSTKVGFFFISEKKNKEVLFSNFQEMKKFFNDYFQKIVEIIGKYKKTANKKYELVVSLNPVDWLLASTSESWSSCLSLESNYFYWIGLPALINDKNRALIYITDGKKKKYKNIIIDRFITRSWLLTARNKKTSEVIIDMVKEYPNEFNLDKIVTKLKIFKNRVVVTNDLESVERKNLVGRYYVKALNFGGEYYDYFTSIYLDSNQLVLAKKNKAKNNIGKYFFYNYRKNCCINSWGIKPNSAKKIYFGDLCLDYNGLDNVIKNEIHQLSDVFSY